MKIVKTILTSLALISSTPALASPIDCLTRIIHHEARGESATGQLGVAYVVLNRSKSGIYPSNVCKVVKQPGQFSNFRLNRKIPENEYKAIKTVANQAIATYNKSTDPTRGALFFFNRTVRPSRYLIRTATIGLHVFFRQRVHA
jgi:N-acetylmuramoyl-L-alanine amidase